MSDVGIAPTPSAPSAPSAPPSNEAVINPNPVTTPTPIGSQAPDRPPEERRLDRRESIQRAFEKAEAARGKVEPAKARMGHNQPPEETKVEREKDVRPGPINLKKRPDDQPKAEPREAREPPVRAEHGHFAPRDGRQSAAAQAETQSQHQTLPEGTPYRNPLPRMHERAKAEWHATPESVRGDVHRMHREFGEAFLRYRDDHNVMNTIRNYHQMAQQHGTSLERALANYTSMEQKLRQDVIGGLDIIVNNLNLRTDDGRKISLQDVAYHILNQSPEQTKLVQSQNTQTAQSHQIGQLHQMVAQLANGIGQMQYERKFAHTRSAVDQFADTHPGFDKLGPVIEQEVKLGFDIDTAYRRAALLNPAAIPAAQTRNGTAPAAQTRTQTAQTRTPDRSISGAPDAGPSNGTSRRQGKPVGRREAIANAMKRANGFA